MIPALQVHLGQLSTNDSYSLWVSEHDGENRIELLSVVFKFHLREGGQVLAKIDVDTLNGLFLIIFERFEFSDTFQFH